MKFTTATESLLVFSGITDCSKKCQFQKVFKDPGKKSVKTSSYLLYDLFGSGRFVNPKDLFVLKFAKIAEKLFIRKYVSAKEVDDAKLQFEYSLLELI